MYNFRGSIHRVFGPWVKGSQLLFSSEDSRTLTSFSLPAHQWAQNMLRTCISMMTSFFLWKCTMLTFLS